MTAANCATKFLIVLSCVSVALSGGQFRIYHGQYVVQPSRYPGSNQLFARSNGEFPYMVSIEPRGYHNCGGAIIKDDVVVTAGHCVEFAKLHIMTIRAGHITREENSENSQVRTAKFIELHPKYDLFNIDIALIKLNEPFVFNKVVQPVKLVNEYDSFYGQTAVSIGWGVTETIEDSKFLKKVELEIITNAECGVRNFHEMAKTTLCAFDRKHQKGGICGGDSGSPLVIHNPQNPAEDLLVGLVSTSAADGKGCDTTHPPVYANIATLRSWLDERLQNRF